MNDLKIPFNRSLAIGFLCSQKKSPWKLPHARIGLRLRTATLHRICASAALSLHDNFRKICLPRECRAKFLFTAVNNEPLWCPPLLGAAGVEWLLRSKRKAASEDCGLRRPLRCACAWGSPLQTAEGRLQKRLGPACSAGFFGQSSSTPFKEFAEDPKKSLGSCVGRRLRRCVCLVAASEGFSERGSRRSGNRER